MEETLAPPTIPSADAACLFSCSGRGFAVRLGAIAEVISVDKLVRLPAAPPRVLGLAALRRDMVPVAQLTEAAPAQPGAAVLILRGDNGPWGIAVDPGATRVWREPAEESGAGPLPEDREVPGAVAWARYGGGLVSVIDPQAAWGGLRDSIGLRYAHPSGDHSPR